MLAAQIDAPRVHRLHALPRVEAGLEDRGVVGGGDAGVVVEDVDAAEAFGRGRVHRLDRRLVRDVHLHGQTADLAGNLLSPQPRRRRRHTTCAPSSVKRTAASAPIPPPAPVITQTLPSSRGAIILGRVEHVLHLAVAGQAVHAELAAEAAPLEAAKRRRGAHRRVRVDREHPGLDRPSDAQRPAAVLASRSSPRGRSRSRSRSGSPRPRRRTGSGRRPGRTPPRARSGPRGRASTSVAGNQKPLPFGASPRKSGSPSRKLATVSRCAAETSGPISVASSSGSPTFTAARRLDE